MAGNNSIQLLRGTAANIAASNAVALEGQPVYDLTYNNLYVGDGVTPINELPAVGHLVYSSGDNITLGKANASSPTSTLTATVAIGYNTYCGAGSSIAIGYNSNSNGTVIGANANGGSSSVAIGSSSKNIGGYGVAIGSSSTASAHGVACGYNSNANSWGALSLGDNTLAASGNSAAIGDGARTQSVSSIALGRSSIIGSNSVNSISIGTNSSIPNNCANCITIGVNSSVYAPTSSNSTEDIVIGKDAKANASGAIVIGSSSNNVYLDYILRTMPAPNVNNDLCIGIGSNCIIENCSWPSIGIGTSSYCGNMGSIAIGTDANCTGNGTIAIGSTANNAIVISGSPKKVDGAQANSPVSIAIGGSASTSGDIIGDIAIGYNAQASYGGTCIGANSRASSSGISYGDTAFATVGSVAIGNKSSAGCSSGIAIGIDASTYAGGGTQIVIGARSNISSLVNNSIIIGSDATLNSSNSIRLGNGSIQNLYCQKTTIETYSDSRLKEDVELADTARCLEDVNRLPVSRYKYKNFAGTYTDVHRTGFMADDVEKVFPKEVSTHDEFYPVLDEDGNQVHEFVLDEDGNQVYEEERDSTGELLYDDDGNVKTKPVMKAKMFEMKDVKTIAMEGAIPTLWAAVQELSKRLKICEQKIAELESK